MAAKSSKKVIYAALIGNSLIALTKFIAAAVTGSSAMLSEGIHSAVDTGNQVLLLWGIHRAGRPANERFPYGYGKEIYFWSFVVAILVFALGAGVSVYEGIHHLQVHTEMRAPTVNYIVLSLALIFESAAWYLALVEFRRVKGSQGYWQAIRRGKDPTVFVVLFEDTAAILGILAAFAGVFLTSVTHNPVFDAIASIVIGLILAATALVLALETKGLLIGESASPEVISGIRGIINGNREIERVIEVLTMHVGPEYILVNISVDFADQVSSVEIEQLVARLDLEIKAAYPLVKRVFIEAEAWAKPVRP